MELPQEKIDYKELASTIINNEEFRNELISAILADKSFRKKFRGPQGPRGKSGKCDDEEVNLVPKVRTRWVHEDSAETKEKQRQTTARAVQGIKEEMRKRNPSIKFKDDKIES